MHSYDWSLASSTIAFVMVQINKAVESNMVMESITAISAVVFCLTAIVKFIDLVVEKSKKWRSNQKTPNG